MRSHSTATEDIQLRGADNGNSDQVGQDDAAADGSSTGHNVGDEVHQLSSNNVNVNVNSLAARAKLNKLSLLESLPAELLAEIFHRCHYQSDLHVFSSTLTTGAISKSLDPYARRNLYWKVSLGDPSKPRQFALALESQPHLAKLVRIVYLDFDEEDGDPVEGVRTAAEHFIDFAPTLTRVHSIVSDNDFTNKLLLSYAVATFSFKRLSHLFLYNLDLPLLSLPIHLYPTVDNLQVTPVSYSRRNHSDSRSPTAPRQQPRRRIEHIVLEIMSCSPEAVQFLASIEMKYLTLVASVDMDLSPLLIAANNPLLAELVIQAEGRESEGGESRLFVAEVQQMSQLPIQALELRNVVLDETACSLFRSSTSLRSLCHFFPEPYNLRPLIRALSVPSSLTLVVVMIGIYGTKNDKTIEWNDECGSDDVRELITVARQSGIRLGGNFIQQVLKEGHSRRSTE